MVANAVVLLVKSFVESLFYILLLADPYKATAKDLDRIIGVNLRGTFLCYKYAGLQMISQGPSRGGRIIGTFHVSCQVYSDSREDRLASLGKRAVARVSREARHICAHSDSLLQACFD